MRFEEYVNNHFDILNDTEKTIVDFVFKNRMDVSEMSISLDKERIIWYSLDSSYVAA